MKKTKGLQKIGTSAFIWKNKKVLLVRRPENEKLYPEHWEMPGGKLEFGETPEEGLAREVKEETGLKVDILGPFSVFSYGYNSHYYLDVQFFCRIKIGKIKLSEEHDDYLWAEKADLKKLKITKEMRRAILNGFKFKK